MRGLVLAGTSSGVGKTVTTLAVGRAIEAAGADVQPAKAGPDFIDPSHHTITFGTPSRTLDGWLQGETGVRRNYSRGTGDVCLVEGMMGLYDGKVQSTAAVAETLGLPVVLVVDASAGMESVAATAVGFEEYANRIGRDIDVTGVIAQRAHGGRHETGIRDALPDSLTYFGRIPPRDGLEIPDRHLGLEMGAESPLDQQSITAAAETIDAERLLEVAREPPDPATAVEERPDTEFSPRDPVQSEPDSHASTVAVARDHAFCFSYPATLERLRELAEVVTFSPVDGETLPACDGVYLPGGYPELHADELTDSPAIGDIAAAAREGRPVLGECGGLMALSETLTTADGTQYEMAGVLPAAIQMADRYQALDHVQLETRHSTLTADAGESRRGHEFHYSTASVASDARFAFDVARGTGIDGDHDGLIEYQTLGTYCHLHPESGAIDAFVERL